MRTIVTGTILISVLAVAGAAWLSGCGQAEQEEPSAQSRMAGEEVTTAVQEAICVIHPTAGHVVSGEVRFSQTGNGVKIVADIDGLEPGQKHGIHIHEYGDCSAPDGTSAGGHYNPEGHPHGLPDQPERHAGDLGNIHADKDGHGHLELTVSNISIDGRLNPILGRAVILHAQPDDGGQPTGNAGARIGCGVIGVDTRSGM